MLDLIVLFPDHCLSIYFSYTVNYRHIIILFFIQTSQSLGTVFDMSARSFL